MSGDHRATSSTHSPTSCITDTLCRLQIISDLHLESPKAYDVYEITPKAPHLALLGDIGNVSHKDEFLNFITSQLRQFQTVFFVPGNHEAYGSDWSSTLQALKDFEREGEFVLLIRGIFELPPTSAGEQVVILGCSLFSHIPPHRAIAVEMGLADFFQINSWDTRAHNEAHARDLEWLNRKVRQLEGRKARIILLTHWSPTTDSRAIDPRHTNSPITAGFSTDLSSQRCMTSENVVLWAFGHTHYNCDFAFQREKGMSLRLMTNQRGYYFAQAEGFDLDKVVEL
ncbi:hypothetical protein CERZMDRAFT_32354 [Cercospora zeae-maydis SCOH1-5]|uniref:Calcineurin-like phosphoesterase domain-containing protein n=1 Tax=Cercospora zeae-maydis SCOH1-5 TaxID=717836 RepID=A0A6A6FUM0_9PEZI|nr:hypothetical protein CERZMDRAFT_32354 [Cercospora zeae-maydis SCOH1-5]